MEKKPDECKKKYKYKYKWSVSIATICLVAACRQAAARATTRRGRKPIIAQVHQFKVKCCSEQLYSHALVSIRVVELHVVASLDPADGPGLLPGYRWDEDSGGGSEVRRPVAQDHAGRLVDAGGVGVDGAAHLQDDNTVAETLGLASDALDAAHRIKWQRKPQQRPEFWGEERCMKTARGEGGSRGGSTPPSSKVHAERTRRTACIPDPRLLS